MGAPTDRPVESLRTEDGLTLVARSWQRPDAKGSVVLVHGFAASILDRAVVRQAEALVAAGFNVLTYDARGHGGSDGVCTLGDRESSDVAAAVAAAQDWGLPVVIVGASMGGIAVLRYAAQAGTAIAGLVSVSAASAWRVPRTLISALAALMTRTPIGRRIIARHLRVNVARRWTNPEPPVSLIERIEVPVAVVHGQRDRFIRPSDAVELYRAGPQPKRLDLVPGMGHAFDLGGLGAITASVEWVLAMSRLSHAGITPL